MANNRGQPSSQHQAKIDENEIFGANKQVTATFSLEQNVTQDL